jgi:hypothetical protein
MDGSSSPIARAGGLWCWQPGAPSDYQHWRWLQRQVASDTELLARNTTARERNPSLWNRQYQLRDAGPRAGIPFDEAAPARLAGGLYGADTGAR